MLFTAELERPSPLCPPHAGRNDVAASMEAAEAEARPADALPASANVSTPLGRMAKSRSPTKKPPLPPGAAARGGGGGGGPAGTPTGERGWQPEPGMAWLGGTEGPGTGAWKDASNGASSSRPRAQA